MNCVPYYRISTSDQKSIPSQKEELTLLAQKNNWQVLKEYTEVGSGKNIKDRPAIQELISDLPRLSPDYLLVVDQDRLSRGDDFWLMKSILRESGVKIATLQQIIDLEKEDEDLTSDLFAIIAKFERNKIISRMKRGLLQRIKEGYHHGEPPYGYDKVDGKLIINENESIIIKRIFALYLSGKSTRVITQYLKDNHITTKSGMNFDHSLVWKMIRNKVYAGHVRIRDNWYQGRHEAIITPETFSRVENIRAKSYNGIRGDNYLLKGIIKCGICHANLTTGSGGNGRVAYYCLFSTKRYGKKHRGIYVGKYRVDEYVLSELARQIDYLNTIIPMPNKNLGVNNSQKILSLERKIKSLETDYYINDRLPKERFEELKESVLSKIVELKSQEKKSGFDYSILKDIDGKWFIENASLENKRALACQLIEKVIVYPANGKLNPIYERLKIIYPQDIV